MDELAEKTKKMVTIHPFFSKQNSTNIRELSVDHLDKLYSEKFEQNRQHVNEKLDIGSKLDVRAQVVNFKPNRFKLLHKLRIVLPHVGLVLLSTAYTLLGAAIFYHFELPYELHVKNLTRHRVWMLKRDIIHELWTLATSENTSMDDWTNLADHRMNSVIEDVFRDYTKNFMTHVDIINGTGPVKWTFGASLFFSLTAITTIGYGHIVPRTVPGRVACLVYALMGIPLILVTIADVGRFLSIILLGGILWVHCVTRKLVKFAGRTSGPLVHFVCCRRKKLTENKPRRTMSTMPTNDTLSDVGTFEDISDIRSQISAQSASADTRARADELHSESLTANPRVSVLFVLIIIIGYTAGGACLMRLWEDWSFFEAFYYCVVTVTTIGFGDIVPQTGMFLGATLAYIVVGLIITTMCIDLVGSEYIKDIHFYGRSLGRRFMTIGDKVVHIGEVFGYMSQLQRQYGLTADQMDMLATMPEQYLLDCILQGRQPDLRLLSVHVPYVPPDIYYFRWIEQPRTVSFSSSRVLASMESLEFATSKCSNSRNLTPREYYQKMVMQYCKAEGHMVANNTHRPLETATEPV